MRTGKCSLCNRVLPFDSFPKSKTDIRGRRSECKFCYSLKNKTKRNPMDFIHLENDPCHICGITLPSEKMAIDHCHSTGTIRGKLCVLCNTAIGKFKDDIELLEKAIEYLKRYKDGERRKDTTVPPDTSK